MLVTPQHRRKRNTKVQHHTDKAKENQASKFGWCFTLHQAELMKKHIIL